MEVCLAWPEGPDLCLKEVSEDFPVYPYPGLNKIFILFNY